MYGAPGPGYQGHDEQLTDGIDEVGKSDPFLKVGPRREVKLTYPEYTCFFPTILLKGKGACEESCPEKFRDNAKCQRNGWHWAERVVELRVEREREKAEREREKAAAGKGNKNKKETEGSENDNPENDGR